MRSSSITILNMDRMNGKAGSLFLHSTSNPTQSVHVQTPSSEMSCQSRLHRYLSLSTSVQSSSTSTLRHPPTTREDVLTPTYDSWYDIECHAKPVPHQIRPSIHKCSREPCQSNISAVLMFSSLDPTPYELTRRQRAFVRAKFSLVKFIAKTRTL